VLFIKDFFSSALARGLLLIEMKVKTRFKKGSTVMKKTRSSPRTFIDPVCLMDIESGMENLTFTHRLRTYYFCTDTCRKAFKENPDKYLEPSPKKRKSWWGRYLERLNKATGGTPPKCH
jgi:YHS domain-containing protein